MNSEKVLESFEVSWAGYGDDVIDHFRKKSSFFRDTWDNQEHDAKNRLSISGPSPEKPVAEVESVKNKGPRINGTGGKCMRF